MDPFKRALLLLSEQYVGKTTSAEVAQELPELITQMQADPASQPPSEHLKESAPQY